MPKKKVEKEVYREAYMAHALVFPPHKVPAFTRLAKGFKPVTMELRAAGRVMRGDKELEYQDIRLYVEEES